MIIPNSKATGPFFKTEKSHSHMPYLILVTLSLARIQRSLLIGYASSRAMAFFHLLRIIIPTATSCKGYTICRIIFALCNFALLHLQTVSPS